MAPEQKGFSIGGTKAEPVVEAAPAAATTADIAKVVAKTVTDAIVPKKQVAIVNQFKAQRPNKCAPGMALIADRRGDNPKSAELLSVVSATSSGTNVYPCEGRSRGAMLVGSLLDQINGGQMVILHYTPYPAMRDDGVPHVVNGRLVYPHERFAGDYVEFKGSYYNKAYVTANEMLKAAKAESSEGK